MTKEELAEIGLAVVAKDEAKQKLAKLRGRATELGTRFSTLGAILSSEPETIKFEEKVNQKLRSGFRLLEPLRFADFDPHEVDALAQEIRTATAEEERLAIKVAKYVH